MPPPTTPCPAARAVARAGPVREPAVLAPVLVGVRGCHELGFADLPSPARSVAWPPPFPYSSPASRRALKPSGLTIGTTIVRVFDHEVEHAGVTAAVAVVQLERPLHRVLARRPFARVVHAHLEEDGPAVAGVHVLRDLDALDRPALVGLVVQRDRTHEVRVARAPAPSCPRCSRTGAGRSSGRSGSRMRRSPRRTARLPRAPAATGRPGPGPRPCTRSCCRRACWRRPRRRAPPRRSPGPPCSVRSSPRSVSSFLRARLAVATRTSDALRASGRVDRNRLRRSAVPLDALPQRRQACTIRLLPEPRSPRPPRRRRCRRSRPRGGRSPGSMIARSQSPRAAVRRAVTAPADRHRDALLGHSGAAALSARARLVDRARRGDCLRQQSRRRRRSRHEQDPSATTSPIPPA